MLKLSFLLVLFSFKSYSQTLKLDKALSLYSNTEQYKFAINEINIFTSKEDQLFSGILPSLELNSSFTRQPETSLSFIGNEQRQTFLTLRQPLFQGMKQFAALNYAQKLSKSKLFSKESVKREIKLKIGNLFLRVHQLGEEIKLYNELITIKKSNYNLVRKRQKIGKSKMSELLTSKASLAISKAEIIQLKDQQKNAIIDLKRILQIPFDDLVLGPINSKAAVINIDNHPSIKAAKLLYDASDDLIKSSKSGHYPTVDFSANYYLEQEGVFNERDWDVAVNLNLPIYSGGKTTASVLEQKLNKKNNFLNYQRIKKDLRTLFTKIESNYNYSLLQIKAYKLSTEASYKSYIENLSDYKLKLTNDLNLNNSLESYIKEKQRLIRLKSSSQLLKLQLLILNGDI